MGCSGAIAHTAASSAGPLRCRDAAEAGFEHAIGRSDLVNHAGNYTALGGLSEHAQDHMVLSAHPASHIEALRSRVTSCTFSGVLRRAKENKFSAVVRTPHWRAAREIYICTRPSGVAIVTVYLKAALGLLIR